MKIHSLLPLVLPLLLAGCREAKITTPESPSPQVSGEKVVLPEGSPQIASLLIEAAEPCKSSTLRLNGRLVWDDGVTVRIFTPFAGRVTKILAEAGQLVAPEDPLAVIASPDYGQAQAEARRAASDLVLADRTLTRIRELFEHGAAARKDLESAEADLARTQSEKQRTSARLAFYGGDTTTIDQVYQLKSPLGGIVVERNINPGQEVRADQMLANAPQLCAPLFVVTDPSRLWVQLDANEHDLPRLKPGQPILVRSRVYPEQAFPGRVEVLSDYLDPNTRTVKVRATVDNAQRRLKAEMFVSVELTGQETTGTDVAPSAVFVKGEKHFLYLEEAPGRFARREVKVGPEHEGRIVVLDGVQAGQRVVTNGCLLLEQLFQSGEGS